MKNLIKLLPCLSLVFASYASLTHAKTAPTAPVKTSSKPFQRALVVAGGGISPMAIVGMIDEARARGWNPDVVITTCGSSIGAAIANSYRKQGEAIAFGKSRAFHESMLKAEIKTSGLIKLKNNMDSFIEDKGTPDYINNTLLHLPETLRFLPKTRFSNENNMSFIVVATRSNLSPRDIGTQRTPTFNHVYFTDNTTAQHIKGRSSPITRMFPQSNIASNIEVYSDVRPEDAARASISDPFLINPMRIKGDYYFTGASDLFPIELAQSIANEVVVTYPEVIFQDYEENIFEKSFAFSQTKRLLSVLHFKNVKWIDMYGIAKYKLNPKPFIPTLKIKNQISKNYNVFQKDMQKLYDFGRERLGEALSVAPGSKRNVRTHLRAPINPNLYFSFTCENANVWKSPSGRICTQDRQEGCNRKRMRSCTPIR